jgi:hypothetical protein
LLARNGHANFASKWDIKKLDPEKAIFIIKGDIKWQKKE